jgi:DNA polymerase-1
MPTIGISREGGEEKGGLPLQPTKEESLYLIDGHAVLYRFHYAFKDKPLRTTAGVETSAVYGMAKLLATLIKNYPVTHLAVIFDPPHKTWRKEFYPEYKATRTKADDITQQIEMAYHLIKTWGVYTNAFTHLEADDAIGILARQAEAAGMQVYIVSRDKDFAQLVSDKISLLDLGQSIGQDAATIIDRQAVKAKWGVFPEQMVDYLSLLGDASDNVPGVAGVGKKGAADLLSKHGTIEEVYRMLTTLPKGKKAALEASVEVLKRNRKLITLAMDYSLPVTLEDLKFKNKQNSGLFELLESLELFSIIKILAG